MGAQLMSCYHKSMRQADVADGVVSCKDCGRRWTDVKYVSPGLLDSRMVLTHADLKPWPKAK